MISSFYSNPKKLPRKIKKKPRVAATVFSSGIQTNSIYPLSSNTGAVNVFTNNQYNQLVIGGSKGTTHNGPISFNTSVISTNMNQLGYCLNGYPDTTVTSSYTDIGATNYLICTVPSSLYSITRFTPGNYIVCINGNVQLTGTDGAFVNILSGCIYTPTSTVSKTGSVVNFIDGSLISLNVTMDSNQSIPITCSNVFKITSSAYAQIPTTYYVSLAIVAFVNGLEMSNDIISINIKSYSITRIG